MFTVQKFLNLLTGNFFYVFSQDSSTASLKKTTTTNNHNQLLFLSRYIIQDVEMFKGKCMYYSLVDSSKVRFNP